MISDAVNELVPGIGPSVAVTSVIGLLMLLGLLTYSSVTSDNVLPGIPELKGVPVLGAIPMLLKYGASELLCKLIAIGDDGISYANVVNNVIVSIHDPAMFREVLAYPDEIASREGDSGRINWSPFSTLRRLIGNSLFNAVGHEASRTRNVFIREFTGTKSMCEKFSSIQKIATAHAKLLTDGESTAEIDDFRTHADNFAVALWGELLYANPNYHVGGQVIELAETVLDLAGNPWRSIWYSFQIFLGLVTAGEPMRSEAKVRTSMKYVIDDSLEKLEQYERNNPDAPLKIIRSISSMSGGSSTGPLSTLATEFTYLNLFGGHHSIGSITTWLLIELNRHPESLAKLMTEIESIDTTDFMTVNSKMPYFDAVVKETIRLYPTVHATVRVINREIKLVSGKKPVFLKPGMLIYLSFLHVHTSPDFWGTDAAKFIPDRFLGKKNQDTPFLPFGYGPRTCVGYKLAILAIKVYLIKVFRTYRVNVKDNDHKLRIDKLLETDKPVAIRVSCRT